MQASYLPASFSREERIIARRQEFEDKERARQSARYERADAMLEKRKQGWTFKEIGELYNLTGERIKQITDWRKERIEFYHDE